MLPILIGSGALLYHGYPEKPNDYDLIVDKTIASQLALQCEKKIDNMYWFGNHKIDMIIVNDNNNTDVKLFELCNQSYDNGTIFVDKITICDSIQVLVPPLEFLYAIKKSHIHRILSLTGVQENDIQIWKKHMNMYNWMRQKLDYTRMDWMIYGDKERYAEPLSVNETYEQESVESLDNTIYTKLEPRLAYLTRKLFLERFRETNERIGDTEITLQEGEEEFFDDNVERFIGHDELHAKVSSACRDVSDTRIEPLFKKYQKNSENVGMDKELYLKAPINDQHQIIREEIMVLFLERKWIPELINCHKKPSIPYLGYNKERKFEELDEIIAHFITNLCGQGHYWLRRFCLDHYEIYSHLESYDLEMLEQLALQIVDLGTNNILETLGQILTKIDTYDGSNAPYFKDLYNKIEVCSSNKEMGHYILSKTCIKESIDYSLNVNRIIMENLSMYDDEYREYKYKSSTVTLREITNNIVDTKLGKCRFEFKNCILNQQIVDLFNKFDEDNTLLYCYNEHVIFYDIYNNIGLTFDMINEEWKLFTIKMHMDIKKSKKNKSFQISGSIINLQNSELKEEFCNNYTKRCKIYYYYSSEDSCEWENKYVKDRVRYLSSYGNMPKYLGNFFEYISKLNLNIELNDDNDDEYYDDYYSDHSGSS